VRLSFRLQRQESAMEALPARIVCCYP